MNGKTFESDLIAPSVERAEAAARAERERYGITEIPPSTERSRRFLAEHGPGGRPLHLEHSQAESEARSRARGEAA